MDRPQVQACFEKWCKKLRLVPDWDIRLEFVEDPEWRKTGDFKVDCDDKKAILLLNGISYSVTVRGDVTQLYEAGKYRLGRDQSDRERELHSRIQ